MSYDVFISYKSEEYAAAAWVRDNLEANSISCWMAPESIPGGSNYPSVISQAMEECHSVVLMVSSLAQTSQWIAKEVDLAFRKNKTVLPFMLEDCVLTDTFDYYLTDVQRYPAYEDRDAALRRLITEIYAKKGHPIYSPRQLIPFRGDAMVAPVKKPAKTKPAPAKAPEKASSMAHVGWLGLIIGLIVAAAVIALVVSLVGSPLLGIDAPANNTTTQALQEGGSTTTALQNADTTTTVLTGDTTTTNATTAAPSGEAFVVGEASMDVKPDASSFPRNATNVSRDTAVTIPYDAMVGGVLAAQEAHWYTFTTAADVTVYRVAGIRVTGGDIRGGAVRVTLYDAAGLKQKEFYLSAFDTFEFKDLLLDSNTTYYLRAHYNENGSYPTAYGLFVSPRASDTGMDKEGATPISFGQKYTFVLNSTVHDWLSFVPEEGGRYQVTVYNVDVGCLVNFGIRTASGSSMGSGYVKNEDSKTTWFNATAMETYYLDVHADAYDDPNGTYVIEITKED